VVLATGPLTSPQMAEDLRASPAWNTSAFDAASPIVVGESINRDIFFLLASHATRDAAYLNCPMNPEQA